MIKLLVLLLLTTNVFAKCVVQQTTVKQDNRIAQQIIEVCDDNQKFDAGAIGFSGKLALFRKHPDFPGLFTHNGTVCKWFLDNEFTNNNVLGYHGIICQVGDNWTVVDKF
jgi:hypothetical protein